MKRALARSSSGIILRLAAPLAGRFVFITRNFHVAAKHPASGFVQSILMFQILNVIQDFRSCSRRASASFLPRPVLRERVGVRVFLRRDEKKPSPYPSPGVPGEGTGSVPTVALQFGGSGEARVYIFP